MPSLDLNSPVSSYSGQLNLYGFQRIDDGPEKGGFVHQYFQKGQRSLCNMIKRQRKPTSTPASSSDVSPLPGLPRRESGVQQGALGGTNPAFAQEAASASASADASIPQNQQAQAVLQRMLREKEEEKEGGGKSSARP